MLIQLKMLASPTPIGGTISGHSDETPGGSAGTGLVGGGAANQPAILEPGVAAAREFRSALVRPEGRVHLVGASPTRAMVGWPGSWQEAWLGNWLGLSPATKTALRRGAGATRFPTATGLAGRKPQRY